MLIIFFLFLHASSLLLYQKIAMAESDSNIIDTTTTTFVIIEKGDEGEGIEGEDEKIYVVDFGGGFGGGYPARGGASTSASSSTTSSTSSTTTTTTVPSNDNDDDDNDGGGRRTTTTSTTTSITTTTTLPGLPECPSGYQACESQVQEECICGGGETCLVGDYCCATDGLCEQGLSYCLYGSCRGSVPFPGHEEPSAPIITTTTTTTTVPEPIPNCPSDRRSCESRVEYKCICGGGETCHVGDYCCAASGLCESGLSYCQYAGYGCES